MHISRLFKIGLLIALSVALAFKIDFWLVVDRFDPKMMLAAFIVQPVIVVGLILQGIRHAGLVAQPGLSYLVAIKAVTLSQGLNLFLPARLSEVLKATYLRDTAKVPFSIGLSAVLLERTVDLIIVGLLGSLCLFFFASLVSKTLVTVFTILAAIIVCVALWGGKGIQAIADALPWPPIGALVERIYLHFSSTLKKQVFFRSLWLGVVIWGISYINIFVFLSVAGSLNIGVYGALLVFVCTTVGGAVPVLPGGLGTYEAAAVFALKSLGYSFEEALALAIAIHISQLILPSVLAIFIMLTERLGLSSLINNLRASATKPEG
jgi:uncharacterized membrane protein YbhN (UPF0104 family)